MQPLQVLDCCLLLKMRRLGPISTGQSRAIARVQKSLDSLVSAELGCVTSPRQVQRF